MPHAEDEPRAVMGRQLNEFFFGIRKPLGMFGRTNWGVSDVSPETIPVRVFHWPAPNGPEIVATRIRDAMRDLLRDMVPGPRFRALFRPAAPERELVVELDFYPGSGAASPGSL